MGCGCQKKKNTTIKKNTKPVQKPKQLPIVRTVPKKNIKK